MPADGGEKVGGGSELGLVFFHQALRVSDHWKIRPFTQSNIASRSTYTMHYLCFSLECFINSWCRWGRINFFWRQMQSVGGIIQAYQWCFFFLLMKKLFNIYIYITVATQQHTRTMKTSLSSCLVGIFLVVLKKKFLWFQGVCVCLLEIHRVVMLWYKSSCRAKQILWIDVVLWLWVPSKLTVSASGSNPVREERWRRNNTRRGKRGTDLSLAARSVSHLKDGINFTFHLVGNVSSQSTRHQFADRKESLITIKE